MEKQTFGERDSYIVNSVLPKDLADCAYEEISKQTKWNSMLHKGGPVPRLISVQGKLGHGHIINSKGDEEEVQFFPLYRHPADVQIPCVEFLPLVAEIAKHVSTLLGQELNHALVQYYRTGDDIITEHSDKTLDISDGTVIVNVSLGYTRTMTLRTKKTPYNDEPRKSEKVVLKDNSLFVLGPLTNQKWLHGIRADKTESGRREGDAAGRISLTLRTIGTFVTSDGRSIFGLGVKPLTNRKRIIKTNAGQEFALNEVITDDENEVSELYQAFSAENQSSDLSRGDIYNTGSNVVT